MYPKIHYTPTNCHEKFHICIDMRTHYTFDISVYDLQHDLFEIFIFGLVFSPIILFDIHNIVCVWYVIYVSGDISGVQTITFINSNRYMWNVPIFTILEGFNCAFLVRRVLEQSPQKGWRVLFIFLLLSHVFWCPPYSMGFRYHQNFRVPLRLTNNNFHAHILSCITFYYDICHVDKYWTV